MTVKPQPHIYIYIIIIIIIIIRFRYQGNCRSIVACRDNTLYIYLYICGYIHIIHGNYI